MSARILVVEDDAGILAMLDRGLKLAGHAASLTTDVASARRAWTDGFDVVLLDVMLPDGNGIDLLAERRSNGDQTPVVLLTAREEAELRERAVSAGADGFLAKPFAYADLLASIERATRSQER